MLVNGAVLKYSTTESGTFTAMTGMTEAPDVGGDANKVEHSAIDDEYKQYELGQKDPGDIIFKFRYRSNPEKTQYSTFRGFESNGTTLYFQFELADGFKVAFSGTVATKLLTAGGPDTVVDWQLSVGLASDFVYTDAPTT